MFTFVGVCFAVAIATDEESLLQRSSHVAKIVSQVLVPGGSTFPTFASYVAIFDKVYEGDEAINRESVYNQNIADMEVHNADESQDYKLGVDVFSDLTQEEFIALPIRGFVGSDEIAPDFGLHMNVVDDAQAPSSVNWIGTAVNPPQQGITKGQGACNSCWAFAAVASVEGAWQRKKGKLLKLSQQQLVDCHAECQPACKFCQAAAAFRYWENNAIASEASYPYTAKGSGNTCKTQGTNTGQWIAAIPKGHGITFQRIASTAEALYSAISKGPCSANIFSAKLQGVVGNNIITLSQCGSQSTDHAVSAVGYDKSGTGYIRIKNSWGTEWGSGGFARISTDACSIVTNNINNFAIIP